MTSPLQLQCKEATILDYEWRTQSPPQLCAFLLPPCSPHLDYRPCPEALDGRLREASFVALASGSTPTVVTSARFVESSSFCNENPSPSSPFFPLLLYNTPQPHHSGRQATVVAFIRQSVAPCSFTTHPLLFSHRSRFCILRAHELSSGSA